MGFSDWEWALGAGCAVLGSVCSNFGVNIQKYSFMQNEKKPSNEQEIYFKQTKWLVGLFLVIFGSIGDFVALGLAAQSIVAPIGSVTLVANIFFAHYWLGESLGIRDVAGTLFIVVGSTLAVFFGDHTQTEFTLADLVSYYKTLGFAIYAISCAIVVFVAYSYVKYIEPFKKQLEDKIAEYEQACVNKQYARVAQLDMQVLMAEEQYSQFEKLHPFCYCLISGVLGGQNILFGKMVAELIQTTISGDNQMIYFLTYVFLTCMFVSIFSQLHFLARALQSFDAMYVVPVFQCFFISVSTIAGAAYFGEFGSFTVAQALTFPLGLGLTLFGVYILSSRDMSVIKSRDEDDADEIASVHIDSKVKRNPGLHFYNKDLIKNKKRQSKYGIVALHESEQESRSRGTSLDDSFDDSEIRRGSGISLLDGRKDQLASDIDHQNFEIDSFYYNADEEPWEETVVVDGKGNGRVVFTGKREDPAMKHQKIKAAQTSLLTAGRQRSSSVDSTVNADDYDDAKAIAARPQRAFQSPDTNKRINSQSEKIMRSSIHKSNYARMRAGSLDRKNQSSTRSKRTLSHGKHKGGTLTAGIGGGAFFDNLVMMGKAEDVLIDKWEKMPSMPVPPVPGPLVRAFARKVEGRQSIDVENPIPSDIVSDAQTSASYGSISASDQSPIVVVKKNKKKKKRRKSYVTGQGKQLIVDDMSSQQQQQQDDDGVIVVNQSNQDAAADNPAHEHYHEWLHAEKADLEADTTDEDDRKQTQQQ